MAPRLVQNFGGYHASIFGSQPSATETLEVALGRIGLGSIKTYDADAIPHTDFDSFCPQRDVLFMDGDIEFISTLSRLKNWTAPPAPIIGLVGIGTPGRLKGLISIGCTALLNKPVHNTAVYSALFLGVNQFMTLREMEWRIEDLEKRRSGRRWVVKAIVALMQKFGITDDEAYARLRQNSMRMRMNLETYCEQFTSESSQDFRQSELETKVGALPEPATKRASS